jgi:sensor histidine kinase regulating citrate/malate metabolism
MIHRGYLLISIENPYTDNIVMKGGLPLSSLEGHGYGTRSITAIADAHGGQAIFNAENGVFTLKIMLPIKDLQQ